METKTGNYYVGLFLNEATKQYLQKLIPLKLESMIIDHVTLYHSKSDRRDIYHYLIDLINKKEISHPITITHIGFSDKALAFKVKILLPCINKNPHITILTIGSGKPVDSNYIENWEELNEEVGIFGTLQCKFGN